MAADVPVDQDRREKAVERLVAETGMPQPEAEKLVDAATKAAVAQFFEVMLSVGQPAGTVTSMRADQIRHISEAARRVPSEASIRTLLRITPTATRAAIASMKAAYGAELRTPLADAMRADVVVEASGDDLAGLKWVLRFTEAANANFAAQEITRLGLAKAAVRRGLSIEIPQKVERIDTLKQLEIDRPT